MLPDRSSDRDSIHSSDLSFLGDSEPEDLSIDDKPNPSSPPNRKDRKVDEELLTRHQRKLRPNENVPKIETKSTFDLSKVIYLFIFKLD